MKKQKILKQIIILICTILLMQSLYLYINVVEANTYTQVVKAGIENFPSDYQEKLNALKEMYPNWKFTAYYTGITWNEFIQAETSTHLRNTVIKTSDSLWKDSCEKIASGYVCASKPVIQYFADPRNFINESGIFQFLEMTYNEQLQTEESVKSIIKNSFMDKEIPVTIKVDNEEKEVTLHYSKIIMEAAKESRMSPYSIAIKIIQEVGRNGSSSVSGHYVASDGTVYDGYYNFFNYGAYDSGDAIANGLVYAKNNGWTNPYIAIVEGSKLMANSYTNAGQNTAYFYKWDVVGTTTSDLYWHQYMTNIQDPSSQSKILYNTYVSNNLLAESLSFVIPVFENMPNANNLPTTIDTTLESSYYLTGSDVRVRENPSTSSTILTSLNRDEVVTLLNWDAGNANGYDWAKIRLANGIEGYIARIYLKQCNNINNEQPNNNINNQQNDEQSDEKLNEQQDIIINSQQIDENNLKSSDETVVKVNGDNLITLPNTKKADILKLLGIEETKLEEINIDINEIYKTDTKVIINGKEYRIIVLGDVFADGDVDARDYMKIKNYIMETSLLSENEKKAADVFTDDAIDARDYMKIKNYIMGTSTITI